MHHRMTMTNNWVFFFSWRIVQSIVNFQHDEWHLLVEVIFSSFYSRSPPLSLILSIQAISRLNLRLKQCNRAKCVVVFSPSSSSSDLRHLLFCCLFSKISIGVFFLVKRCIYQPVIHSSATAHRNICQLWIYSQQVWIRFESEFFMSTSRQHQGHYHRLLFPSLSLSHVPTSRQSFNRRKEK